MNAVENTFISTFCYNCKSLWSYDNVVGQIVM